ncbi:MAG: DUF1566 domain-containing protein [Myxococcales bacterium]
MRRPPRSVAQAFLVTLASALGPVWACSSDDSATPPAGASGSAGKATTGGQGQAGENGAPGGNETGGTETMGGAPANEGGTPNNGGATAGAPSAGDGGAAVHSLGGAGGGEGTDPGPPDLVTASGGPWPDSLTGACASSTQVIVCPQRGDAFYGQDGTYRLNVPSYSATASTLKDSVTGLVWQLTPEATTKTQGEAVVYCEALELAGQSDWRLPTRLEYVSVLDEGMGSGYGMPAAVSIDTVGAQWTASATGTAADQFFIVDDQLGSWTVGDETTPLGARCVRGPVSGGSLQVDADTVTDNATRLVWQLSALDETPRTWQEALAYCEALSHAGKDDWRLPSIKELATLVDESATVAPALHAEYGTSAAARYWSSTPARSFGATGFALALETSVGYSPSQQMSESAAARCVRSQD